jgi:thioredoxin reductase (NADPH)
MNDCEDLIIIGSGPAGHTAAIYAARANLNPLMFEGFESGGVAGGQLMITTDVENFPGFPEGVTGPDLMDNMRKQSVRFGTRIKTQDVTKVETSSRPFVVHSEGKAYKTRAIIVATGASAKSLGLENELRLYNKGVSACATCDGALPMFRNKELVVVGGGDTAMEEASFLTRFASRVHLVHRRDTFRASKIMLERARKNEKINIMTPFVVDEIVGEDHVTAVKLKHTETGKITDMPIVGVFVAIGHQPNAQLFDGILDRDDNGYIKTQDGGPYTNVEGIFACGDVQDHVYRQAITAAGSGCQAAIAMERWLQTQEELAPKKQAPAA